jgi:5-methylcytosine-specific restriction endonuclease McrA
VQLGHASVFYYLHRDLKLSKGAAHYRKVAARLIQEFPEVVTPFREGKLCISTVVELARVITPENSAEVLPRFFYLSKQEAKAVAVEICPAAVVPRREVVTEVVTEVGGGDGGASRGSVSPGETPPHASPALVPAEERALFVPLTPNLQRLHMTVSKQFIDKLEAARKGQGHAQPGASAEKILEAALDLLLAQQAKRRAEVKRPQKNPHPAKNPNHIPAAVKRAVWSRDEGKCQWPVVSGGICGSTLRLEIDHVVPRGRGGPSTVANCRLACRLHNQLAARQVYGDKHMDLFTRSVPVARETETPAWPQVCPAAPYSGYRSASMTAAASSRLAARSPLASYFVNRRTPASSMASSSPSAT